MINPKRIANHFLGYHFTVRKAQVIAIIHRGGKILSIGVNETKFKGHVKHGYRFTFHAEYKAIRNRRWPGCKMTVLRILKNGEFGSSFPCGNCRDHIDNAGIIRVTYYECPTNHQFDDYVGWSNLKI